ncbi:MAG: DUF4328 domain-containing protein [Candidatus Caenarcaniphilales bacterium]|nr:DUF4328 domain-containing protein [Candidatus Caenarcaniphilales bacterium]
MDTKLINKLTFSYKTLSLLLKAGIVVSVIALFASLYENRVLVGLDSNLKPDAIDEKMLISNLIVGLTALFQLILSVVTLIFGARFLYFAHKNIRENLKADKLKFTPGWVIGWYFIPVANLWKPFQAMKELWRASKNQKDWWTSEFTSALLPWWWTLWIIGTAADRASFRLSLKAKYVNELITSNLVTLTSDIFQIPLTILFFMIVQRVYAMQMESLKRIEANEQEIKESFN